MNLDENQAVDLENNQTQEDVQIEGFDQSTEEIDWKAEALKQKAINARLAKKAKEVPSKQNIINSVGVLEDEALDLRIDGYSKDDVKFILQNGGRKSLEDKNSLVSLAINARRQQAAAERAAVDETDTGKSEVEKKYSHEQLREMSTSELEKVLKNVR